MTNRYEIIIYWSDEDQSFIAEVPELAGCMADGQTPEEALANLRVVAREWLEVARDEGRPIPPPMTIEDMERLDQRLKTNAERQIKAAVQQALQQAVVQAVVQQAADRLGGHGQVLWQHRVSFRETAQSGEPEPAAEPVEKCVRGAKG